MAQVFKKHLGKVQYSCSSQTQCYGGHCLSWVSSSLEGKQTEMSTRLNVLACDNVFVSFVVLRLWQYCYEHIRPDSVTKNLLGSLSCIQLYHDKLKRIYDLVFCRMSEIHVVSL